MSSRPHLPEFPAPASCLPAHLRDRVDALREDPTGPLLTVHHWCLGLGRGELERSLLISRDKVAAHLKSAMDAVGAASDIQLAAWGPVIGAVTRAEVNSESVFGTQVPTERRKAVLRLLVAGVENPEIGRRLQISGASVNTHVIGARRFLATRSRAHLAASCVVNDLVPLHAIDDALPLLTWSESVGSAHEVALTALV